MTKNITCKEAQIALETAGLDNFSDRFASVIDMRIDRCMKKDMFTLEGYKVVSGFFNKKLELLRPQFDIKVSVPTLIFTDMHAENFFIGFLAGCRLLEFSQSCWGHTNSLFIHLTNFI